MEFDNNIPIYIQVIEDIKKDIVRGVLELGEKLPSGRDLAMKYKINPNTANRIYKEMEAEELCFTKRGLGTFVTEDIDKLKQIREEMAGTLLENFLEGMKHLGFSKEDIKHLIDVKYDEK
ncbi:GntR family transcriptional regulator [Anaerocolumna cellulosilytica]|uniref:GntR family transcriptional regulator n=1 Tax=Anaerocolumna cellulosilytica TaxID=433286 RepID=A0A6S6R505_9FIRM|nr:GntR family transcriptional regulator [Anaerocolumna cellulosilytica]MBB5194255.1 DNA-binding transcriptional regulator YhcF (GntR family) [Anaerocolumna cellulosilytica]BCJ94532.1 GntR family transcriptional regulator [Anaerocolumna cellulosilytica]